ncbi:MAG: DivIVA domain-containing protein [Oscillospiraceae bacterium]
MISPNDIINKKFDKGMKGYRVEAVDKYLEEVASEMADCLSEKKDLETKIDILAEKLEEYKNDEDSLRVALLSAQRLGDSVIKEAKSKADSIVKEATVKAERLAEATQKQIEKEHISLLKLQKEVGSFKNRLMAIYKQHLELINALPTPNDGKIEEEKEETLEDIKDFAERIPNQTITQAVSEENTNTSLKQSDTIKFTIDTSKINPEDKNTAEQDAEQLKNDTKNESRFGPLRFGEGYELKRDN